MPPLSIMLWLPAASGLAGALLSFGSRRRALTGDAAANTEPTARPQISVAGLVSARSRRSGSRSATSPTTRPGRACAT